MKKLTLLFLLFSTVLLAQTTQTINSRLKLNTVPIGTANDSLLVRGADKIVKRLPKSAIITPPSLQQVTNTGNVTSNVIHADSGVQTTWQKGSLNAGTAFSGGNRKFSFVSNGDGFTVPADNSVQLHLQPDLPIQIRKNTETGSNTFDLDDLAILSTTNGIILNNQYNYGYIDSNGFGIQTDNPNKTYFRTDNLTSNTFLQVPNVSGTIAVKGDINFQDILNTGGEVYLGSFPDALGVSLKHNSAFLQQQRTQMFDNTSYSSNVFDLNNYNSNGVEITYTKGSVLSATQTHEASMKLNENGIGLKTTINSNHAYFRTDNLTGIGDKTYQMPDVSGGTLLTTKGTTNGFPIDGNIQMADGERDLEIFNTNNDELNYRGSIYFGGTSLSLTSNNDEGNSIVTLTPDFFSVSFSDTTSPGIVGQEDYSNNLLEYSFVQKPYVDKNRLKEYTVATLPAGILGDTAFVNDALSPTYLGTLTGGGSVKCPVFFNGSVWVAH